MNWRSGGRWWPLLSLPALLTLVPVAGADEPETWNTKPPKSVSHQFHIRRFRGDPFYGRNNRPHTFERAGYPCEISRFAHPSESPHHGSYYVGGGCTYKGGPPGPVDGTYGWDYVSIGRYSYRVVLNWCHKYKGGYGAYKVDGPPVFDVGPYVAEFREVPGKAKREARHGESHESESHSNGEGHNGEGNNGEEH